MWLTWLVVGLVAWWAMGQWTNGNSGFGGWWASLILTLVGTWLGDWVLGDWLWMVAGFNVVAGLIGGVVFNWLWGLAKSRV